MDAQQFRARAEADEVLSKYLEELIEEASPCVPDRTAANDLLLSLLSTVAAHALYLWLRDCVSQADLVPQALLRTGLERAIDSFARTGFTRQEATDVITAVSSALATRPPEGDALDKGMALVRND